jgi:hyperosmotically inducible periplasmic protein
MNGTSRRLKWLVLPVSSLLFGACLLASPSLHTQNSQQPAADNTAKNKDQSSPSADQHQMNPADRAITQKIRKAIHEDKTLSTYAHNIKIITQDGKVTLRGPVRSEDEKNNLEAKAASVAGQENVMDQLEIAPSK